MPNDAPLTERTGMLGKEATRRFLPGGGGGRGRAGGGGGGGTHILEEEKKKKRGREGVNQLPKTSATQLIIKTRTVIYIFSTRIMFVCSRDVEEEKRNDAERKEGRERRREECY